MYLAATLKPLQIDRGLGVLAGIANSGSQKHLQRNLFESVSVPFV
jgi:hypothetical protein